ncbi:hypothetical protein FO519_002065 [Halicephalobus sp. NKZ332]|nr:hypothetical protein FO519_002065 [Halicephalobus sp. NKZ332]
MSEIRIVRDVLPKDEFEKRFVYSPDNTTIENKITRKIKKKFRTCSLWNLLKKFFPILRWLPEYKIPYLSTDIIAGSTVAILNIPQAMAYAALAGVPAIIGLYTSFFPPILYMLFGTSKHISLGMFAVVALMTANVEQRLRSDHTLSSSGFTGPLEDIEAVQIVATLTFAVGLVLAVMALLQIHYVSAYMSDELIGGFTTGSAVHVAWSQIPKIFALKLPQRDGLFLLFKITIDFFKNIKHTNYWALVISVCCMVFLYLGKTYVNPFVKKFCPVPVPLELIVVIVTTILSNTLDFHKKHGIDVVGKIPTGLPIPTLPKISKLPHVFPDAIVIAIVIYAVSFSMAKLFAKKHRYKLNPAQEVRAMSACQIFSSFVFCHPVCASLSRSTINSQLEVNSQLSGLVSSGIMLLLILWIGPLVEQLPMCVLASIILVALQTMLLQITQLRPLWKVSKYDFLIWLVSFLGTILWDVSEGLVIAICFTLLTIVIRTQVPKAVTLGQVDETEIFRNPQRFSHAFESPFATVFRFEAPLLFVNCDRFKTQAMKSRNLDPSKLYFVIDAGAIFDLDKMGSSTLMELSDEFARSNVKILIADCNEQFVEICSKCGVFQKIEKNYFFESVLDAVVYASKYTDRESRVSSIIE